MEEITGMRGGTQWKKMTTKKSVIVKVIFLGQFCQREKGATRLTLCDPPNRETRPDHHTRNYVT